MSHDAALIKKMDAFVRGLLPEDEALVFRAEIAASSGLKALEKERLVEALLYEEHRRQQIQAFRKKREALLSAQKKRVRNWRRWAVIVALFVLVLAGVLIWNKQKYERQPTETVPSTNNDQASAENTPAVQPGTPPKADENPVVVGPAKDFQKPSVKSTDLTLNLPKETIKVQDCEIVIGYYRDTYDTDTETAGDGDISQRQPLTIWEQSVLQAHSHFRKGEYEQAAMQFEALINTPNISDHDKFDMQWYKLLGRLCWKGAEDAENKRLLDEACSKNRNFQKRARKLKEALKHS